MFFGKRASPSQVTAYKPAHRAALPFQEVNKFVDVIAQIEKNNAELKNELLSFVKKALIIFILLELLYTLRIGFAKL